MRMFGVPNTWPVRSPARACRRCGSNGSSIAILPIGEPIALSLKPLLVEQRLELGDLRDRSGRGRWSRGSSGTRCAGRRTTASTSTCCLRIGIDLVGEGAEGEHERIYSIHDQSSSVRPCRRRTSFRRGGRSESSPAAARRRRSGRGLCPGHTMPCSTMTPIA